MINPDTRTYDYYALGTEDEYGQEEIPTSKTGTINMSIYLTSQFTQDNINYEGANYIGITHNRDVSDSWIIDYEGKRLKVLYVNPKGRFTQVYMGKM